MAKTLTISGEDIASVLLRVPIGVYFVVAGANKILAEGSIAAFAEKSMGMVPGYMPAWFGPVFLHALPPVEMLVGLMLTFGLFTRVAAVLAALMLISFIMVVGIWDGGRPFHGNLVFLGLTLALVLQGGGQVSIDALLSRRRKR